MAERLRAVGSPVLCAHYVSQLQHRKRIEEAARNGVELDLATLPGIYLVRRHLVAIDQAVRKAIATGGRLIISMPPRHGKALALDTPVPTPTGWTTMGELRTGDEVMDEQGRPTRVVGVSPVWRDRPVYRVTSDTGEDLVADEAHEWRVRACRKRPWALSIHDTAWLARPRERATMVERADALDLPDAELPIEPYVLGVWLGDGSSWDSTITQGDQDMAAIRGEVERCGYPTRDRKTHGTFGVGGGMRVALREAGLLRNKHVPAAYLRASRSQRLALLQGLVDTDGHVAPDGQVEFCATNRRLAEGVLELVRTLGTKASMIQGRATIEGRDCGHKYRVMFYMAEAARLERKRSRCRDGVKQPDHYVRAEPCGTADTVCIEVESPSHLFLVGRTMIPTHNSETVSKYLPFWYLGTFPDRRVILASYEAAFAASWGGKARDLMDEHGMALWGLRTRDDSRSRSSWQVLGHDGGMVTAGVGGPLTGKGGDLIIVDDPVKNAREAMSPVYRDAAWEWYQSTLRTRLEPGGAMVLMATRWHKDDLLGRVLRESDEEWEELNLKALAEGGETDPCEECEGEGARYRAGKIVACEPCGGSGQVPRPGSGDPLGREEGEALWPERYPAHELEARRREAPYWFAAMYQGSPRPLEGGIFNASQRRYYTRTADGDWQLQDGTVILDRQLARFQTIDVAASERTSADYTVVSTWGWDRQRGHLLLLDIVRVKQATPKHRALVRAAAGKWKPMKIGIERATYGLALLQELRSSGLPLEGLNADTDKVTRALQAAALYENGQIHHPQGAEFVSAYEDELDDFPNGDHDDQVDTAGYAALMVAEWTLTLPPLPPSPEDLAMADAMDDGVSMDMHL